MPEGPECRKIAEVLAKAISGKKITSINVISGRYTKSEISGFDKFKRNLPLGVAGAGVHGKFIYLICEKEFSVWNTLGMSGSWKTEQTAHSRVVFNMSDGDSVYFEDMRNFGTLKMVHGKHQLIEKLQSLGPDMLNGDIDSNTFIERFRKRNKDNICKVLMDQAVVSGVGNYLKSDSLWLAKIYPYAKVSDLSDLDLETLHTCVKKTIVTSYEFSGATINALLGIEHGKGDYLSKFLVYNRKTDEYDNPVVKEMTPDGRKTHWVKEIQTRGKK